MNDRIAVALRVLGCIKRDQTPLRADIQRLRRWVSRDDRTADTDELACIVIRSEIHPVSPRLMSASPAKKVDKR